MTRTPLLPDVHFVNLDQSSEEGEEAILDVDDEELPETPEDVVAILGFDPLKEDWKDGS